MSERSKIDGKPLLDIVDRLRGIYRGPVNDGAGLLDGLDYFESRFDASELPPIHAEAADEIERLRSLSEWRPVADEGPNYPGFNVPVLLGWKHWSTGEWCYEAASYHFGRKGISESFRSDATHWMPLPEGPSDD